MKFNHRPVMPTPFDDDEDLTPRKPAKPAQTPRLVKRPNSTGTVDQSGWVVDTRRTKLSDPSNLANTPKCAKCGRHGAGSTWNGKSYHMSCKLEAKRSSR